LKKSILLTFFEKICNIGDHAVKKVGVTADPEVLVFDVEDNDCFMVMASDGVWEFISSQESVEIVQACLDDPDCALPDACQELIEEAASRWQEEEGDYRDDVRDFCNFVYSDYLISFYF